MINDTLDAVMSMHDYPTLGSRKWFDTLWSRSWHAGMKAGWTFRQSLRICEGAHLCIFPTDLDGMPKAADDWDRYMVPTLPLGILIGDRIPTPPAQWECEEMGLIGAQP